MTFWRRACWSSMYEGTRVSSTAKLPFAASTTEILCLPRHFHGPKVRWLLSLMKQSL
jgi:hypothetical protein